MNWFNQWFLRKWRWAWENRNEVETEVMSQTVVRNKARRAHSQSIAVADDDITWGDGLRITVKKMIGGYVVSFRVYDHIRDRNDDRHYIITDDSDFNLELGKIITMESIRQS